MLQMVQCQIFPLEDSLLVMLATWWLLAWGSDRNSASDYLFSAGRAHVCFIVVIFLLDTFTCEFSSEVLGSCMIKTQHSLRTSETLDWTHHPSGYKEDIEHEVSVLKAMGWTSTDCPNSWVIGWLQTKTKDQPFHKALELTLVWTTTKKNPVLSHCNNLRQ